MSVWVWKTGCPRTKSSGLRDEEAPSGGLAGTGPYQENASPLLRESRACSMIILMPLCSTATAGSGRNLPRAFSASAKAACRMWPIITPTSAVHFV